MKPMIKPLGIGDLKVVKQKLARYEAGEIAHIENIMARESRSRKHRRLQQFEEIVELEQERTEESVRDLQSTERFEMEKESKQTIRSETSFQAGVEVSTLGPVRVTSSAKFATNTSKEESNSDSTKYAKDITEKTQARLVEKVRQLRRTRTLEESEETNEHGFNNTKGEEHISGIYRWVDKYYRAKVVDYGKRLMYQFFVPEPAAFYTFATQYNLDTRVLPSKPTAPAWISTGWGGHIFTRPLSPSDIQRGNYLMMVERFNAEGVQPPPPEYITIAKAIHLDVPKGDPWSITNEELKIPKGYQVVTGDLIGNFTSEETIDDEGKSTLDVFIEFLIGCKRFAYRRDPKGESKVSPPFVLGNETGSIAVSGQGFGLLTFDLNIEAYAQITPEYFEKWQLETYTSIMNAYHKALMDYEDRIAAAQISEGVAIGGNNPEINREIEKQELKRSCLTLWAGQCFDGPPGINHNPSATPPANYPEIDIANATTNATAIEFFEHAFDWKNITYEFLPYFWGRKPRWIDTLALESSDPIFEQFLKAGAARVVVPVEPAYVDAVLYYQLTGNIWTGGKVPPLIGIPDPDVLVPPLIGILDPDAQLHNSYLDELADVTDIPDIDKEIDILPKDETTWLIKVPTTLVWLQNDKYKLPDLESKEQ